MSEPSAATTPDVKPSLPRNVKLLSFASLLYDISSEMTYPWLPHIVMTVRYGTDGLLGRRLCGVPPLCGTQRAMKKLGDPGSVSPGTVGKNVVRGMTTPDSPASFSGRYGTRWTALWASRHMKNVVAESSSGRNDGDSLPEFTFAKTTW